MVKEKVGAGDRLRAALDAALPPVKQRSQVLGVRLSEDEIEALRAEASRRGVPLATFARTLLVEALALAKEGAKAKER